MRLKQLDLLGYKTFASDTGFLFDKGITAIVGPNGSGKSNVADAIRWVLGEQSFSLLRAKKGEDMIFSGSERRARMGLAEVTLTLDNADGWLPIEFGEVTLTRRAYRSGENEYLLNGSRVRLRDVADLLAASGLSRRTYTVVGQGLIDTALSLRPQQRRELIEEAAGLALYQSRRADAMNKLDETKRNLLRVYDLVAEIEPRIKRLKRQAERAEEYDQIHRELDNALHIWYSFQWKRGRDDLHRVRAVAKHQHEQLVVQQALVRELSERIERIRVEQGELRRELGEWHRQSSALHARSEANQRELAVAGERRRMLIQQHEQVMSELAALQAECDAQQAQVTGAEAELVRIAQVVAEQQRLVQDAQRALDEHRQRVQSMVEVRASAQEKLFSLRAGIADGQNRLAQLEERRRALETEQALHEKACDELDERVRTLRGQSARFETRLIQIDETLAQAQAQYEQHQAHIAQLQARQADLRERLNQVDQHIGRLRERFEVLTRMRTEGSGLFDGVRNVLQAAGNKQLHGVVGSVAELIQVPQNLEVAVEVSLGSQLQDVVVRTWDDAQAAIEHLKHTQGGRATLLPLDTLRPGSPLEGASIDGVIGVASDLVQCEPHLRIVVEYLLGRTLVCEHLAAAHRILDRVQGSYQIVTPEGEIVRSSGAVTGGTRNQGRQGGILAREREWRELPGQIQSLEQKREQVVELLDRALADEKLVREQVALLESKRRAWLDGQREQVRQRDEVQRQVEQVAHEQGWYRERIGILTQESKTLADHELSMRQRIDVLEGQTGTANAALAELEVELARQDDVELQDRLNEYQSAVALVRQEEAGKQAELRAARDSLRQIERRVLVRQNRQQGLADQLSETEHILQETHAQESNLREQIQVYTAQIKPAESKLTDLERQQTQLERDERRARARLQDWESRHSHVELQVSRQEDQMKSLRRQIEDDLGLVDLNLGEEMSGQPLLPIDGLVSSLPEVDVLPEGLEEQMHALRRRLHLLGAINPDAPTEYRETSERYEFLSTQSADLEQAITQLREVIAELDEVMEREFKQTFEAIAREFKTYFTRLFNGGSAHLELTAPDDLLNTGIDIVARPPGKRQQGLALLSGGERALIAAALIFAILSVSPTPFCVLDEVDAALDEANVGRFRSVLKSLSEETQFVIITHNRYTIEMADIVYGVSMGDDGVSCVISHRMDDEKAAS
ncbi:MAG: chromosome segregation protein SMC [Anaerolineae bacterium]|nr:chromosome segregation protein SMC [Anaerolineae bacterium]